MKRSYFAAAAATLLAAATPVQSQKPAAKAAPAAAPIAREQVEQLIDTLKQRNEQLRELSAQLREMEARAAAGDAAVKERDNGRKALVVAAQKNRELAEIGDAIIADYEKFNLGKRMGAQEPLTQLYRVKLQNKLQEFQDQIAAQGFYPERELELIQAASAAPTSPKP